MNRAFALALLVVALAAADASAEVRQLRPLWRRDDLAVDVRHTTTTGLIVAADRKGGLLTLDAKTGRTLRRWRLPGDLQRDAVVVGEHLVVSEGESVRAFDVRTGKAEWRRKLDCRMSLHSSESSQGVVVGNCVRAPAHLYVFRDLVVALDVEADGKELWRRKAAEKQINEKHGLELAVGPGRVAFEDLLDGGKVQLVELRTGEPVRTLAVRSLSTLDLADELLLVTSRAESVPGEAITVYDARTGVELWQHGPGARRESGDSLRLPGISQRAVWSYEGDKLLELDGDSGGERTRVKLSKVPRVVYTWDTGDGLVIAACEQFGGVPAQTFLTSAGRVTELTLGADKEIAGVAGKVLLAAPVRGTSPFAPLMAFEL